jgi:H+/gluconate symporter-like permease
MQYREAKLENQTGLKLMHRFFFPLLLILFQAVFEHPYPLFVFLGNPNVALLMGFLLSIISGRLLGFAMVQGPGRKSCKEKWCCSA